MRMRHGSRRGFVVVACAALAAVGALASGSGCGERHDDASAGALPTLAPDPEVAARQALGDPGDLVLDSVRESLGAVHIRFVQLASDGTRVADSATAVHLVGPPAHRAIQLVTTNLTRPLTLAGARTLTPDDVSARALAAAGGDRLLALTPMALPLGAGVVRAGWRAVVGAGVGDAPPREWEVWLDGEDGTATVRRDLVRTASGSGLVYLPNPVTSTGDTTLVDDANADTPTLTAARYAVTLQGLDGTGFLRGDYADVENKTTREQNATLAFDYTRSQLGFEEVNAYHAVDGVQRRLQALGFTGPKAILATPFHVVVNALNADNSYYLSMQQEIQLGKGGVDDAEDADIVSHEYGHAIQDAILPGFGTSAEAGALGEGFGDIVAASLPTGGPDLLERACVAPWDATAYTTMGCLRRVDGQKHYPEHLVDQVHDDGEIWSGAIWDLYTATGLGPAEGLQLVVEAQFLLAADASFADSAAALLLADGTLYGGAHDLTIRRALVWHGLLATITPPDPFAGAAIAVPTTLESAHPIADSDDQQALITQPGAAAIRVHFASLDMETAGACPGGQCDNVYLYDGAGYLYARLGGALGAFDAPAIPGDTVVVRWVSNGSGASPGLVIDRYDYVTTPGSLDAGTVDAAPGTADAAPGAADAAPGTADASPGALDASATPDAARLDGGDESGCGCQAAPARRPPLGLSLAALALFALALATRARRSRSRHRVR